MYRAKTKVFSFTIIRPSLFFAADPKVFFPFYYPHINFFNKIKTFSNLPTLFNFSMQ